MLLSVFRYGGKCCYLSSTTTSSHLNRKPVGSVKIVDLQDEVLLDSLQPLNSDTLVRHPGDRSQVVLAAGEKERARQIHTACLVSGCDHRVEARLLTYLDLNKSGTTTSETRVTLSVSTTKSFTTGLGVPGCT